MGERRDAIWAGASWLLAVMSNGYANLLGHLHQPSSTVPLAAFQGSIAHHLANQLPSPTPLAAAVVGSRLFGEASHEKLQALQTAFRHAVHIKHTALKESNRGLFAPGLKPSIVQWCTSILEGIRGGTHVLRLSCAGGLLLGLEDHAPKLDLGQRGVRTSLEEELVVALAEVLDSQSSARAGPKPRRTPEVDPLSLSLILVSQTMHCVASARLKVLPLPALTRTLAEAIDFAFISGSFLRDLDRSITALNGQIHVPPTSQLAESIREIESSPLMIFIPQLSKLLARVLSLVVESKPQQGLQASADVLDTFEAITSCVELDWTQSQLSDLPSEDRIAEGSKATLALIWKTLKTLLFSTIMVVDAALSTSVYSPPPPSSSPDLVFSPSDVALQTLRTLSNLSFVISQFGGVTSTAENSFIELKRVFYLALDIISADAETSDTLVHALCGSQVRKDKARAGPSSEPFKQAKKAYILASIEQLIPVLSDERIQTDVFPACLPHLSDSTHRETYESSHSVVLAIFAARAQHLSRGASDPDSVEPAGTPFADRVVPFYSKCLIENSMADKLSTSQLSLAYSSLVRSAVMSTTHPTLARFCVQELLNAASSASTKDPEQAHGLQLTLIACVSSLPLAMLPWVLDEIRSIGKEGSDEIKGKELADTLFEEIMERVGDLEKAFTMEWWDKNRGVFVGGGNEDGQTRQRLL